MDGRKRMILGLSIALGAAIAAHLAAMAPCQGQTPPSDYGRASGSETIAPPAGRPNRVDPGVQRSHIHSRYPSSQQMPLPEAPAKPQPSYTPPAAPSNPPPPAPNYTPSYTPNYAPQYAPTMRPNMRRPMHLSMR